MILLHALEVLLLLLLLLLHDKSQLLVDLLLLLHDYLLHEMLHDAAATLSAASFAAAAHAAAALAAAAAAAAAVAAAWVYPSSAQFFRALQRRGKEAEKESMSAVVYVHNFVNEETWGKIKNLENKHK